MVRFSSVIVQIDLGDIFPNFAYSFLRVSFRFLKVYPKGNQVDNFLSLFLEVPDYESLPTGWRRHARYLLTIVNQNLEKNIQNNGDYFFPLLALKEFMYTN